MCTLRGTTVVETQVVGRVVSSKVVGASLTEEPFRVTAHSYMAAEVVNDFFRGRVDPSLLTEYPQQYDVRQDVLEPGKGDTFKRQLKSALNTRNILKSLTERPATLAEIEANSPGADSTAIMAAYKAIRYNDRNTTRRQRQSCRRY